MRLLIDEHSLKNIRNFKVVMHAKGLKYVKLASDRIDIEINKITSWKLFGPIYIFLNKILRPDGGDATAVPPEAKICLNKALK